MKRFAAAASIGFALLATAVGCGPSLGTVTGTVTMDGQPAKGIQVDFEPVAGGASATGFTDDQGNYKLLFPGRKEGAPPGEYVVRLTGVEGDNTPGIPVPAKFNKESDLKRTVAGGANDFDFEITSK